MADLDEALGHTAGVEFDWLALDSDGALALCESAGFGEIPDAVLAVGSERIDAYSERVQGLLERFPETGGFREEAGGSAFGAALGWVGRLLGRGRWKEPTCGVGRDFGTLDFARRGLYVYCWQHWSGPYGRIVVPERPLVELDAKNVLREHAAFLPTLDLSFATTRSFHLARHLPCRASRSS